MTAELIMILATYVEKFEILQDSTDYRDYMDLSFLVWLWKWSLLDLISYYWRFGFGLPISSWSIKWVYRYNKD